MPLHTFERICMRYVAGRRGNRAATASGRGEESVAKGKETSKRILQVWIRVKRCRGGAVKRLLQWARPIFIENRCTLKGSTVLATCQLSAHTRTHREGEQHACVEGGVSFGRQCGNVGNASSKLPNMTLGPKVSKAH